MDYHPGSKSSPHEHCFLGDVIAQAIAANSGVAVKLATGLECVQAIDKKVLVAKTATRLHSLIGFRWQAA